MKIKKLKILVAMSGGVDSSVAAQLLKNQGHDITGVFLYFWKDTKAPGKVENKASSKPALLDARAVAKKIGIPLITLNYTKEFKRDVVDYFLSEYQAGRTPNPCVVCNKQVKLGLLLKYAKANGYDALATGHYLKRLEKDGEVRIYKAKDNKKDQSYFLYTLEQDELKRLYFPLGTYNKPRVREIAGEFGLITASKSDSQDICFLSGPHNNFLKRYLKLVPGEIKRQEDGQVVGEHQGLALYTIGQRRGIEVGGTGPYYVAEMDYKKNILWVVRTWNDNLLYQRNFSIQNVTWLSKKAPTMPYRCRVVIRYGHPALPCLVTKGKNKQSLNIKLSKNTRAITSGQSAVFYQGQRLLGGGVIQ
ncbi:MAG: tRNA 2-thiouridine(34) synthase MnmA [Patescibacteria group bacterium]|nr:tRNA 2-thiouridine(34) synthase MnmA [Patescibacteria group bacterium]